MLNVNPSFFSRIVFFFRPLPPPPTIFNLESPRSLPQEPNFSSTLVRPLTQQERQGLEQQQKQNEERRAAREAEVRSLPDLLPYLKKTSTTELATIRRLSSLASLSYRMSRLTPKLVRRLSKLELVTTSRAVLLDAGTGLAKQTPGEIFDLGDGMSPLVAVQPAEGELQAHLAPTRGGLGAPLPEHEALQRLALVEPLALAAEATAKPNNGKVRAKRQRTALVYVYCCMLCFVVGHLVFSPCLFDGRLIRPPSSSLRPVALKLLLTPQGLLEVAATPFSTVAGAANSVRNATLNSLLGGINLGAGNSKKAAIVAASKPAPVEWFVADDLASDTRYIVIQGSESLESWITNLSFDPMEFEDPALGVKIHRGVYAAALGLYDTLLPLIVQHVDTSPFAKISFVGHSLGGALGTALMLMLKRRGVLPGSAIAPVYTFGGAAAFCDGGADPCPTACPVGAPYCGTRTLLAKLGLPEGIVRNVVMHRDVVPRAFTCDYSLVKDILKNMHVSFREHHSLITPCDYTGKVRLYNFVGRIVVLQPANEMKFVHAHEGFHPLLPEGEGIYTFRQPASDVSTNIETIRFTRGPADSDDGTAEGPTPPPSRKLRAWRDPGSVKAAIQEFMDYPHPLDTLRDSGAYGSLGSISRYHNPDSYTRGLSHLLRANRNALPSL